MAKTGRRLVAMGLIALGLAGTTPPVFGTEVIASSAPAAAPR